MADPEIFFQTLSILEHPADPMVIQFQILFGPKLLERRFGLGEFKAATLRLFQKHARLRSALLCEPGGFRTTFADAAQAAELNELAWSCGGLSLEEFRHLSVPVDRAPILRFRCDPTQGFWVACHHTLMDGFGCFELGRELIRELHPADGIEDPKLPRVLPPTWSARALHWIASRWVMLRDHFRQTREIAAHPTSLLGPVSPPQSQRHFFFTTAFELDELRAIREAVKQRGVQATVNDLILSAFHLALDATISRSSAADRISITVPFNMRFPGDGTPLFCNRTGYVSVSTLPAHRGSRDDALARIHTEMTRAKRYGTGEIVRIIVSFFENTGLLRIARKAWLKHRLPARYLGPEKYFWRNFDTAVVTNLGRFFVPTPYAGWVAEIHGFAPIISPGVSLSLIGIDDRILVALRLGSSVLSEDDGRQLLELFKTKLRSFR